jgi:hypothetical protein
VLGEGPETAGFRTLTAALADLVLEDGETIVVPVPRSPRDDDAEEAILRWAPNAGHTRVWLPERVVAFEAPAPLGRAIVDCPGCGARWEDGSTKLWERVRANGRFGPLPRVRWLATRMDGGVRAPGGRATVAAWLITPRSTCADSSPPARGVTPPACAAGGTSWWSTSTTAWTASSRSRTVAGSTRTSTSWPSTTR